MPTVVGGLAALVALAGGILAQVETFATLERAALAFLLGWSLTHLWYVFFTVRISKLSTDSNAIPAKESAAGTSEG